MKSLDTKLAIVTGAARGIGFATAQLFKQNGYRVALIDKDKEELNNLSTNNVNEKKFCFDISDSTQLYNMYEEILNWHDRIDVLVNNAGIADFGVIEKTTIDRWNEVMKTNLDGAFLTTQKAIPSLKKTKGNIVNIASISGLRASTLRVA